MKALVTMEDVIEIIWYNGHFWSRIYVVYNVFEKVSLSSAAYMQSLHLYISICILLEFQILIRGVWDNPMM